MVFRENVLLSNHDSGLSEEELVLLTHGDSVESDEVAEDFKVIATSANLVAGLSHFKSFSVSCVRMYLCLSVYYC